MDTISFDGAAFPLSDAGLDVEKQVLLELVKCRKAEQKLFLRIQNAPDGLARRVRIHQYLSSPACRLVAMIEQARGLEAEKRLPLSVYQSLALQLSLFNPISEPTEFWDEPKTKGGTRRIHDFGPMNRAAQRMVMRAVSAFFKPRPYQFNVANRGAYKAILAVKEKVSEGYIHVKKLDVRSFFDSFSRDGLYMLLPLPKSVIDNIVMPDNLQLVEKKGGTHLKGGSGYTTTGPSSISSLPVLPQGSLHANIVAEYIVSRMGIIVPKDAVIVIFVDDIFILAKTATALQKATHALLSAYQDSPAGTFKFTVPGDTLLSGIGFLGYRLQSVSGQLKVSASSDNWQTLLKKHKILMTKITKAHKKGFGHTAELERAIAAYYVHIRSWIVAFRAADNYVILAGELQERLVMICRNRGISPAKVKEIAKAQFAHHAMTIKVKQSYKWQIKIAEFDPSFIVIP